MTRSVPLLVSELMAGSIAHADAEGLRGGTGARTMVRTALTSCMPLTDHAFTTRLELDVSLRYLLYLPTGSPDRDGWPLVVFLHGAGERGDDLSLVLKQGLPRLLHEGLEIPAIVISPQLPDGQLWTRHLPAVHALVERIASEHDVDRDRITATGLSLGGAGSYELVSSYPDVFAAIAPICGPWTVLYVTETSARVPTWVFHGDADQGVRVEDSHRLVEAIRQRGGDPRLTIFPGVGHNSWDPAYQDTDVLEWLLQRRLSERSLPAL